MEQKKRLLNFLLFSGILIFILVAVPETIALGKAGFNITEILNQFLFYIATAGGFMLAMFFFFFYEYLNTKDDSEYGNGLGFSSPGEFPSFSFFKGFTQFQLFFLFLITFSTVGLFTYVSKQISFTGVAVLAQQFTKTDSLLFSSTLVPIAENLGLAVLIAFGITMFRFYARKYSWEPMNFRMACFSLILLGGAVGVANHMMHYSGNDIALTTVFVFWTIGALITLVTGSFLPFLTLHFSNNFFFDLGRFMSNENMMIYVGSFILLMVITYITIYRGRLFGVKNE